MTTQGPTSTDHLLNLCLDMDFTRFHCTTPLKAEDHHQVPHPTAEEPALAL